MVTMERNTVKHKHYEWRTYRKTVITYKATLDKQTGLYTVRTCYWTETVKAEELQRFIHTIVHKIVDNGILYTQIIRSHIEITE